MRHIANDVRGNARFALCIIEGVLLNSSAIFVEAGRGVVDEFLILEARGYDFTSDGIGENDIGADIECGPHICPLNRARSSRIDSEETRTILYPLQKMMKENRMRFARIRSPEEDHIRFFDLLVGVRTTACTEYRRQTGDARGMSSTVAAVDIVAADHHAGKLLGDVVHLVRRLRAAEHAERRTTVLFDHRFESPRREIQRLIPTRRLSLYQRLSEPDVWLCLGHKTSVNPPPVI